MLTHLSNLLNPDQRADLKQVEGVIERIGSHAIGDMGSVFHVLLKGKVGAHYVAERYADRLEYLTLAQPGDVVRFGVKPDGSVRSFSNITLQARLG